MRFLFQFIIIGFGMSNIFINLVDLRIGLFLIILGVVAIGFELLYYFLTWGNLGIKKQKVGSVE